MDVKGDTFLPHSAGGFLIAYYWFQSVKTCCENNCGFDWQRSTLSLTSISRHLICGGKKRVHFFSLTKCRKKEVTEFLLPSWVNPVTKKSNVFDFNSQKKNVQNVAWYFLELCSRRFSLKKSARLPEHASKKRKKKPRPIIPSPFFCLDFTLDRCGDRIVYNFERRKKKRNLIPRQC